MNRTALTLYFSTVLLAGQAFGDDAAPGGAALRDAVSLQHCELGFEQSTAVSGHGGAGGVLPLSECKVKLGDRVKAGQLLGRLNDRELRAQLEARLAAAKSDVDVRVGESKRNELILKLRRIEKLRVQARGYASDEEYIGAQTELETAILAVEQARFNRQLAVIQCREVEAQIAAREIRAPHDGVVVEVLKKVGESVGSGETVFQVVDIGRLRVTGYLNLGDYARVRQGQKVEVTADTEGLDPALQQKRLTGRIIFVDRRIDPKTNTCKVIAEVENDGMALASGLEARMVVDASPEGRPVPAPANLKPAAAPAPARALTFPTAVTSVR